LVVVIAHYDSRACTLHSCPERRVGLAAWCREHTDQILEHRESPEVLAHIAAWRAALEDDDDG
jgi:hypothetical protein